MADDTTSKFKKMLSFFEGIRDERNTAANTASRIGRAFIMLLDYCVYQPFAVFSTEFYNGACLLVG